MSKILVAALVGSILCVLWNAMSWMAFPLHDSAMRDFHDEGAVAAVLQDNAVEDLKRRGETTGVFLMPRYAFNGVPAAPPTEMDKLKASTSTRKPVDTSMFVFAAVRPGAYHLNVGRMLVWTFARSLVSCFILALMLSWTMRLDYLQRVIFCALAGLFTGLVADGSLMIWLEMPWRFTLINMADHLCEWMIAGLGIAGFVDGREIWEKIR